MKFPYCEVPAIGAQIIEHRIRECQEEVKACHCPHCAHDWEEAKMVKGEWKDQLSPAQRSKLKMWATRINRGDYTIT